MVRANYQQVLREGKKCSFYRSRKALRQKEERGNVQEIRKTEEKIANDPQVVATQQQGMNKQKVSF